MNPVNVVCMKWGTRYNGPYVNNLYAMVKRHLTVPHRFVCFTDDAEGFAPGIEAFPLPLSHLSGKQIASSWNKLSIFAPRLADLRGPALFLDLDLVIVSNIDAFFDFEPGKFCIIRDWLRLDAIEGNSSVFRFNIGAHTDLLDFFLENPDYVRSHFRGDQAYTCFRLHEQGKLNYWPERWCLSFKRDCLAKWPWHWFQTAKLPPDGKIVVFHGMPKPLHAIRGRFSKLRLIRPVPWVAEHWHA